jgi:hypothetical protein
MHASRCLLILREDMQIEPIAYYNEIDKYAAEWLRNLIRGGTSHLASLMNGA